MNSGLVVIINMKTKLGYFNAMNRSSTNIGGNEALALC